MKLISKIPSDLTCIRENTIIAIDKQPVRILSKNILKNEDGIATDVMLQILALEKTKVEIKQVGIKDLEALFDSGRLEICEDKDTYLIPDLQPGDTTMLDIRFKLIKNYVDSLYPDYRPLQARGIEKAELKRLARLLNLSERQTRRLVLRFLQDGQSKYSLVDGRQTRIQHGYDPTAGAVRGRKPGGKSSTVLNDAVLYDRFEKAYKYLQSILNDRQFQMHSQKKPTAKMAYKWMIRKFYSYIDENGDRTSLPKDEVPSYKRFTRWIRKEKYGNGKIRDHAIGYLDWNNNRRLLVGDAHFGVHHPGELVLIDETELSFDLVTADPSRPGQNVGGAIIHLCVDAATNCYISATVTIQVNNSYEGFLNLAENMLMDNQEKIKILLGDSDQENIRVFPDAIIPEHIHVDHGAEYTSNAIKDALTGGETYFQLEGIATDITLARVATGSDKGLVERPFADFDRSLADAAGYGHGYRSDTPRSKHRIQANVDILGLRRIVYEIVKAHNLTPMTTFPITPELIEAVPEMTPLALWDYLESHYGPGITPDKTRRNLYRYAIMPEKTLQISRKQISYKNILFWDIQECKELFDIALKDKDKSHPIVVHVDPRTVSRIYYKGKDGIVYVLPLAAKRSNMSSFSMYSWSAFESWYKQYLEFQRNKKDKKENSQQALFNSLSQIFEDTAQNTDVQAVCSTTSGIRAAGAVERMALTAYDTRRIDQIFGNAGFKVSAETACNDDHISSEGITLALPNNNPDEKEPDRFYDDYLGLDPDDV